MTITLTPEQEAWFKERVVTGSAASIEEGARRVIDERMTEERRLASPHRRQALLVGELSDAELAELAASEMDPRHNQLNDELT